MKTASQDLIHEHKAIQIALNILEKIRGRLEKNATADYKDINDLLEFLKEFADKCHHGKEEGFLFPALEKAGVKNEGGPIGVMLLEHNQGRNFIKQMQDSIQIKPVNNNQFVEAAAGYVKLIRAHIEKENRILFPMSDVRLSALEQKELLEQFENHEEKVIGSGRHEELQALLEKFMNKYLN
jgi:hemerythrin-like domain-containing protein